LEQFSGSNTSHESISGAGDSAHPHLVSYGAEKMLLAWESGSGMVAQVRSANDGSAIGSEFAIDVLDHDFQSFEAYPDGSVAYPASGSSNSSVQIARVNPCE
jgi:hypothetical protein